MISIPDCEVLHFNITGITFNVVLPWTLNLGSLDPVGVEPHACLLVFFWQLSEGCGTSAKYVLVSIQSSARHLQVNRLVFRLPICFNALALCGLASNPE
jgi:hypothetical protein